MSDLVQLSGVTKYYELGKQRVAALRGVTLAIGAGEFAAIAGPSGSGKSTLLNLVGCMDVPSEGAVHVGGEAVHRLSEARLTDIRLRKLGFIFQSFNLVPVLDVFQNVELPLLLGGGLGRAERKRRVEALLASVGLEAHARHRPAELSGGQQQRVAIARALVTQPVLVLADEPTANLDSATGEQILELMKRVRREANTTFIFSTHDAAIMRKADRLIELKDGLITSDARA